MFPRLAGWATRGPVGARGSQSQPAGVPLFLCCQVCLIDGFCNNFPKTFELWPCASEERIPGRLVDQGVAVGVIGYFRLDCRNGASFLKQVTGRQCPKSSHCSWPHIITARIKNSKLPHNGHACLSCSALNDPTIAYARDNFNFAGSPPGPSNWLEACRSF